MLININTILSYVMLIIDFAMVIWGSVLVFGAWATWTHDNQHAEEVEFCEYSPMIFAFTILLLKWVSLSSLDVINDNIGFFLDLNPFHDLPLLLPDLLCGMPELLCGNC